MHVLRFLRTTAHHIWVYPWVGVDVSRCHSRAALAVSIIRSLDAAGVLGAGGGHVGYSEIEAIYVVR